MISSSRSWVEGCGREVKETRCLRWMKRGLPISLGSRAVDSASNRLRRVEVRPRLLRGLRRLNLTLGLDVLRLDQGRDLGPDPRVRYHTVWGWARSRRLHTIQRTRLSRCRERRQDPKRRLSSVIVPNQEFSDPPTLKLETLLGRATPSTSPDRSSSSSWKISLGDSNTLASLISRWGLGSMGTTRRR